MGIEQERRRLQDLDPLIANILYLYVFRLKSQFAKDNPAALVQDRVEELDGIREAFLALELLQLTLQENTRSSRAEEDYDVLTNPHT